MWHILLALMEGLYKIFQPNPFNRFNKAFCTLTKFIAIFFYKICESISILGKNGLVKYCIQIFIKTFFSFLKHSSFLIMKLTVAIFFAKLF